MHYFLTNNITLHVTKWSTRDTEKFLAEIVGRAKPLGRITPRRNLERFQTNVGVVSHGDACVSHARPTSHVFTLTRKPIGSMEVSLTCQLLEWCSKSTAEGMMDSICNQSRKRDPFSTNFENFKTEPVERIRLFKSVWQ